MEAPAYVIAFNAEKHEYTLNGKPVPSVSKIIEPLYDFRFVKQEDLDRAADFGHKVHKTIELAEAGKLKESELHPRLAAHLLQWRRFKADMKYEPIAFEVCMASLKFQCCGTMDNHGLLLPQTEQDEMEELLLDVKTGLEYPGHKVQTAGYKIMAVESGIVSNKAKRASLYLDEESYKFVWHSSKVDELCFISLNNVYYWRNHNGRTRNA